jgi:hypothetical protein
MLRRFRTGSIPGVPAFEAPLPIAVQTHVDASLAFWRPGLDDPRACRRPGLMRRRLRSWERDEIDALPAGQPPGDEETVKGRGLP